MASSVSSQAASPGPAGTGVITRDVQLGLGADIIDPQHLYSLSGTQVLVSQRRQCRQQAAGTEGRARAQRPNDSRVTQPTGSTAAALA